MTIADVRIESIAAGGDGVARADGVVVFVPRTAPGDRARVELETRKRFARGTLVDLVVPSADRTDPVCHHYRVDRCGGCQIQHLKYDAQLAAKRTIIRDALARIAKRSVDVPEVSPSEKQWRYRTKLTMALRKNANGSWRAGLHPYDDPVAVFPLADCPITDERVLAVWREIMDASRHLPPADELRASVRLTDGTGGAAVVVEGANEWPERATFFRGVPRATALWWRPAHRARSLVAERGDSGEGAAGGASFAQINTAVAGALHEYVLERTRSYRPGTVVDAYAGMGATAVPLARDGARVLAIEADREAVAQCASELPAGSRAVVGRVEDVLAEALPADVVLVNPPRTGLHERVAQTLQGVSPAPRAVIYTSCDPATLARDLTRLPTYRVASIRAFDMFPQTAHVETVCELVPEAA